MRVEPCLSSLCWSLEKADLLIRLSLCILGEVSLRDEPGFLSLYWMGRWLLSSIPWIYSMGWTRGWLNMAWGSCSVALKLLSI